MINFKSATDFLGERENFGKTAQYAIDGREMVSSAADEATAGAARDGMLGAAKVIGGRYTNAANEETSRMAGQTNMATTLMKGLPGLFGGMMGDKA